MVRLFLEYIVRGEATVSVMAGRCQVDRLRIAETTEDARATKFKGLTAAALANLLDPSGVTGDCLGTRVPEVVGPVPQSELVE